MNVNEELKTICGEIFQLLTDDFSLEEFKNKIRAALPNDEEGAEELALWWSLASKGEQKAFVHLLVGDDWDWDNACYGAEQAQSTGAYCDGDLSAAYGNLGVYFARKYGVVQCLEKKFGCFDYEKFGSAQEDLHHGRIVASTVVGEWLIFDDEIEHCIS